VSFYGIRFLLGLAEAGFYPGVVLYLSWWFPSYYRGRMQATFQPASIISCLSGRRSGGLLHMKRHLGLAGWRWLYIMEAVPPIIMCFVMWQLLTDRPKERGLAPSGPAGLAGREMDSERAQREAIRTYSLGEAFSNPKMLLLTLAYVGRTCRPTGSCLPAADRQGARGRHRLGRAGRRVALPVRFRGDDRLGLPFRHHGRAESGTWRGLSGVLGRDGRLHPDRRRHPVILMIAICIAVDAQSSTAAPFWSLPSSMLTGAAAAGASP